VFDEVPPNLQQAIQAYKDESQVWQFSGAKGLAALGPITSVSLSCLWSNPNCFVCNSVMFLI
jgi:hypothetical protein